MSMNKTYCFQIYFFIAKKKKKVGVSLKQRQQRTMKTLIWGSSTIAGLNKGHLTPNYLWENSLISYPSRICFTLWQVHTGTYTYTCTHMLFFFYPMGRCACCVRISGFHDPSIKTNGIGTGSQISRN